MYYIVAQLISDMTRPDNINDILSQLRSNQKYFANEKSIKESDIISLVRMSYFPEISFQITASAIEGSSVFSERSVTSQKVWKLN